MKSNSGSWCLINSLIADVRDCESSVHGFSGLKRGISSAIVNLSPSCLSTISVACRVLAKDDLTIKVGRAMTPTAAIMASTTGVHTLSEISDTLYMGKITLTYISSIMNTLS